MAQEVNISVSRYFEIKDRLVPKHRYGNDNQRKKEFMRKQLREDLQFDTIQKQKQNNMKPIREIQTIMKHFDAKFTNKGVDAGLSSLVSRRKMMIASLNDQEQFDREQSARFSYLINLPEIKTKRTEAQRYRCILHADQLRSKQQRKARIMEQFSNYMQAELKGNPKNSIKRRLNTIN